MAGFQKQCLRLSRGSWVSSLRGSQGGPVCSSRRGLGRDVGLHSASSGRAAGGPVWGLRGPLPRGWPVAPAAPPSLLQATFRVRIESELGGVRLRLSSLSQRRQGP